MQAIAHACSDVAGGVSTGSIVDPRRDLDEIRGGSRPIQILNQFAASELSRASRKIALIAAGREDFGSGWSAIQSSRGANRSACSLTTIGAPCPDGGGPRFFLAG